MVYKLTSPPNCTGLAYTIAQKITGHANRNAQIKKINKWDRLKYFFSNNPTPFNSEFANGGFKNFFNHSITHEEFKALLSLKPSYKHSMDIFSAIGTKYDKFLEGTDGIHMPQTKK